MNHKLKTFIYRASWAGTGMTVRIDAEDEDDAFAKALKRKDIRTAWDLKLIRVEES